VLSSWEGNSRPCVVDSVICPRPPTGSMAYGREISSQCTFSSKECGSLYLYNRNENNKYFVYIMCLL